MGWLTHFFSPAATAPARPAGARVGNFDRLAWCYDALAAVVFGPALRRAQRAALAGLPPGAPHILIVGGGPGWVLTEVLRCRPLATVLYLDASAAMLARAATRLRRQWPQAQAQVVFRHGTQAALRPADTADALVTFFVLDCFTASDFEPALDCLSAALRPGAPWLVADFWPVRRGWRRGLLALMYAFFGLTTGLAARRLPDWPAALQRRGWRVAGAWARFYGGAVRGGALRLPPTPPEAGSGAATEELAGPLAPEPRLV